VHITENVGVTVDTDSFYRQSDQDGIYSPAGGLLRSGRATRASHVGEQVAIQPEWRIDYVAAWVQHRV